MELVPDFLDVGAAVLELVEAGDVVLTLGAGDITKVGPELLRSMQDNAA